MSTELATWLRRQRQDRSWSRLDMARRLIKAGQEAGDTSLPTLDSMDHNVYRWERGPDAPSERFMLYYCRVLGISVDEYGPGQPDAAGLPKAPTAATAVAVLAAPGLTAAPWLAQLSPAALGQVGQVNPALWATADLAYGGINGSDETRYLIEREVHMAAQDGSDHAAQADGPGIGEATMEQLRADVVRLARLTDTGEPFAVFLDLRRVRERIYRVLDRRLWPREQADLHFLLGCLNGLMGTSARRLGYPEAATELTRAGWVHASVADHRPLMARLRYVLSYVEYWQGRTSHSRDLALNGLEYLSQGRGGADLHLIYAQAAARMGDADEARRAVLAAHDAHAEEYSDDLLDIGGSFAISWATHHCEAGMALAGVKGAEKQATGELEEAISLYDAGPRDSEEHWFGGKALAHVDLATIRLKAGALDAANAALTTVLDLPPAQRVREITQRLGQVRTELAAPIFRGSAQASDLSERIEDFTRETAATGLHALSPG